MFTSCSGSLDFPIRAMKITKNIVGCSAVGSLCSLFGLVLAGFLLSGAGDQDPKAFTESIRGTARSIEMIPVAAMPGAGSMWMSKTEIPWEVLDICIYGFDKVDGKSDSPGADAVTRPTKPYIAMDRGFGHAGWPANSVSFKNANGFCEWISAKSGKHYRLPTVAEWKHACEMGKISADAVGDFAWFDENSDGTTHKVGTKKADAQGLHDLYGNLAEWCVQPDGTGVVVGGSYREAKNEIGCSALEANSPKWNRTDPQIPKSVWWLADAGWIGFRVVCDGPVAAPAAPTNPSVPATPKPQ